MKSTNSSYFQFFTGYGGHVFFQTIDGQLWGCGQGTDGQLSIGYPHGGPHIPSLWSTYCKFSPVKVKYFSPSSRRRIVKVSLGGKFSLFLHEGKRGKKLEATSAGFNGNGELCANLDPQANMRIYEAVRVVLDEKGKKVEDPNICDVIAGIRCSYMLTVSGCVYSGGLNNFGQLGQGPVLPSTDCACKIEALSNITKVAAGDDWAIFMGKEYLFGCGYNFGQFSIGRRDTIHSPVKIDYFKRNSIKIDDVVACKGAAYFTTGQSLSEEKRTVYVAGNSQGGQFGNGESEGSSMPVKSAPLSNFQLLCNGSAFDFFLFKKNGKIYATGNCGGFKMDHHVGNVYRPLELKSLEGLNVVQLATRYEGSFALLSDGSVYAVGGNNLGECMTGGTGINLSGSSIELHREKIPSFEFVGRFDLRRSDRVLVDVERLERLEFMTSRLSLFCVVGVLFL